MYVIGSSCTTGGKTNPRPQLVVKPKNGRRGFPLAEEEEKLKQTKNRKWIRTRPEDKEFLHHPEIRRHHFDYDDLPLEHGVIPEEFLRRFTDTDSRPMTPTPTVLSQKSHGSSLVHRQNQNPNHPHPRRRCVTPDAQTVCEHEKKRIILDLRRSHSQETLCWNASSEFSASTVLRSQQQPQHLSTHARPKNASTVKEKGILGERGVQNRGVSRSTRRIDGVGVSSTKRQVKEEGDQDKSVESEMGVERGERESDEQRNQMQKQLSCIYSRDDLEEEPRRRGKRKRRGNAKGVLDATSTATTTNTFHPRQQEDPETQVSNVAADSVAPSQRPSIVANGGETEVYKRGSKTLSEGFREALGRQSFLDEGLLSQLRRGLSIQRIEMNFHIMMQRALTEALKGVSMEDLLGSDKGVGRESGRESSRTRGSSTSPGLSVKVASAEPESVKSARVALNLPPINHDQWITLPRKYSRMVSRFELPIDSKELTHETVPESDPQCIAKESNLSRTPSPLGLSPLQYLSRYVQVSNYRKQLYHRIFVQFLPEIKLDDLGEFNLKDCPNRQQEQNKYGEKERGAINHRITTTSSLSPALAMESSYSSLSMTELYMSQRGISWDQLKDALSTAILCPCASAEMIENILQLLQLSGTSPTPSTTKTVTHNKNEHRTRLREEESSSVAAHPPFDSSSSFGERFLEGIGQRNPSTSTLSLSVNAPGSSSVKDKSGFGIDGDDLCNGKYLSSPNLQCGSTRGQGASGAGLEAAEEATNTIAQTSFFADVASRIVANHSEKPVSQLGIADVVMAAANRKSASGFAGRGGHSEEGEKQDPDGEVESDGLLSDEIKINFRTWCGIVAFSERYTTNIQKENDSRQEMEIADFETLDRRINGLDIHPNLKTVLYIIKN